MKTLSNKELKKIFGRAGIPDEGTGDSCGDCMAGCGQPGTPLHPNPGHSDCIAKFILKLECMK
jgi:hypothetical protein